MLSLIAGKDLYEPPFEIRKEIAGYIAEKVREKFGIGEFNDSIEIANVFEFICTLHYDEICKWIKGVDSKWTLSFLLYQFELFEELGNKNNPDGPKSLEDILFIETIFYLCDLIVEKKPTDFSEVWYFKEIEIFHKLWIYAESIFKYSSARNWTQRIGKDKSSLKINPQGHALFLDHNIDIKRDDSVGLRTQKNSELRKKYDAKELWDVALPFLLEENINEVGFEELGFEFFEIENKLFELTFDIKPITSPAKIPCISTKNIEDSARDNDWTKESLTKILDGYTLKNEHFIDNPRKFGDYKTIERCRKRPLLEINYDGVKWRLFSPKMIQQRAMRITEDILFNSQHRIPKEWDTQKIRQTFARANDKKSLWFENITEQFLQSMNIRGLNPNNGIEVNNDKRMIIPNELGSPDFIGYSNIDNSIIVIECKCLNYVFESMGEYQELQKFTKEFIPKFKNKINWVKENFGDIKSSIGYKHQIQIPNDCDTINFCFVTYYPNNVHFYYDEIPTPTLFELIEDYETQKKWPYLKGILKIS